MKYIFSPLNGAGRRISCILVLKPSCMKILYVDDDSEDREVFIEILSVIDPNINVIEASNGLETINLLASGELPDIIFLDINMPLLNGDQTLVEIRKDQRLNDTKVVMYSTSVNTKSIPTYINLNAQYINKPYTVKDGIRILSNVILSGPSTYRA